MSEEKADDDVAYWLDRWARKHPDQVEGQCLDREDVYRAAQALRDRRRAVDALAIVDRYGNTNRSAHHLEWIIDQMVRALTGDGYAEWVRERKAGADGPETYAWGEGIAP